MGGLSNGSTCTYDIQYAVMAFHALHLHILAYTLFGTVFCLFVYGNYYVFTDSTIYQDKKISTLPEWMTVVMNV